MEIDDIKQRKIVELQEKLQRQQEEHDNLNQAEAVIMQYFTTEAQERYSNIKVAHSETAMQVIAVVANAVQSGKLRSKIDDNALREILKQLSPKRDIKITRK